MSERKPLLDHGCRWEEVVEEVLKPVDVIAYHGESDWQGSAEVLLLDASGNIISYAWSWGSCSGCDAWEDEPPEKVRAEIDKAAQRMDPETAADYLIGRIGKRTWGSEWITPEILARVAALK